MTETPLPHALVVGGTGMLRGVVLHLANRGFVVSVIARGGARLAALTAEAPPERVNPIALDYGNDAALRQALALAIGRHGPLLTVVAWVRDGAPWALETVADCADRMGGEGAVRRCRFFRVLGSAAADPARPRDRRGARFKAREGLRYREVILGFRIEGGESRWNTNDEIAAGVIDAIERDAEETVVGVVRPWDMNPRLRQRG